jgi:hypothetical protein
MMQNLIQQLKEIEEKQIHALQPHVTIEYAISLYQERIKVENQIKPIQTMEPVSLFSKIKHIFQ